AVVSSRSIGLACYDFPLCNGLPLPAYWNGAIGWQFTHRLMGYSIFTVIAGLALVARLMDEAAHERRRSLALLGLVCVQILLGGINVWYRIPPMASAAHLAVAVFLFAVLVDRNIRARPPVEEDI
ncbi:MAG: COX15/CtaA family protein, partial [Deltaproteobacteria bacterium]